MENTIKKMLWERHVKDIHAQRVFRYINDHNPDFERFFKWERKFQEKQYDKFIQTNSNIWTALWSVVQLEGVVLDYYEDFLESAYEYKGYVFELYVGQGCFYRVLKNNELVFQST